MGRLALGRYGERVLRSWGEPFGDVRLNPLRPDVILDEPWYLHAYPDVARAGVPAWEHFVTFGDAEGRSPGPDFDPGFYRRTYLTPEATKPAHHYIATGRGLGYRGRPAALDADVSAAAMRAAITLLPYPIVLVGNDAQRAGAPILVLEIATDLVRRGFSPVFLLHRGGPLLEDYRAIGPTFILDEGWDVGGFGAALRPTVGVFGSTGWSAPVLAGLSHRGPQALLVYEMVDYLAEHSLLQAVAACRTVVAPMPGVRDELADRLPGTGTVEMITPGLRPLVATSHQRRAVRRRLEAAWGPDAIVFLGAGYADRRKGFDRFLAAAHEIAAAEPRARFVWLGELGAWARTRADEAIQQGLPLVLPGFRTDAAAWYRAARVYLLTSRQDPGPTTVMDAARLGTPFVGFASDIGLRAFGDLLEGVGSFAADQSGFVAEALRLAHGDTAEARRRRAGHIAELTSFGHYTDALLDTLRGDGALDEPPADRPQRLAPRVRIRQSAASVRRILRRFRSAVRWFRFVPAPLLWRAARLATALGRATASPVSLAVGIGVPPPPGALRSPSDVAALRPGESAWLARPSLLAQLARPAALHLVRDPQVPPWSLLRALADSPGAVIAVEQYDVHQVPDWVAQGGPPPPVQGRPEGLAALPPIIVPAARGPVAVGRPLGVFLHAYHLDLVDGIAARLDVIGQACQLYVSTDTEAKAAWLRDRLPRAVVRVFPNRGRDVFPRLFGFADAHADHDLVLHLHTKRSPQSPRLAGWLEHNLDRLLPPDGVDGILGLFLDDPRLGMVAPAPFGPIMASYGWGANRPIADILTWGTEWQPLPDSRQLSFPAGSMFWARSEALAPLRELAVPPDVFPHGLGLLDGTVAHALERLSGVSPRVAGLTQVFVDPPRRQPQAPVREVLAAGPLDEGPLLTSSGPAG